MRSNLLSTLILMSYIVVAQATWQSLYSPFNNKAYLKLSTDDILVIDYTTTDLTYGDSVTGVVDAPTSGNYSLGLANGDLYAFYGRNNTSGQLQIAKLNDSTSQWEAILYNTTATSGMEYYSHSTIMTNLPSDEDTVEAIYIYGGKFNGSISNRLVEFNPHSKTVNLIMTSISPTAFYGGASSVISSSGKKSVAIGGKASSGWVSMFQIAVWEYKSWSFKTVPTARFSVNSRVDSLSLPVFNRENDVTNVFLIGGTLAGNLSTPFVLNLNVTDSWSWSNMTNVGDFTIDGVVGGFVLNDTLVSIKPSSSSKRAKSYRLELYDIHSLDQIHQLVFSTLTSSGSSSSLVPSTSSSRSLTNALPSSDLAEGQSTTTTTFQSNLSTVPTPDVNPTRLESNSKSIVIGVVVPVILLILIAVIVYFIYKKYKQKKITLEQSDTESTNTNDYYNELKDLVDTQSINSWNDKRAEYEQKRLSTKSMNSQLTKVPDIPNRKSTEFTFENITHTLQLKNLKKAVVRTNTKLRTSGPFVSDEDLEDEFNNVNSSPMTLNSNKSRNSFLSINPMKEDYEEQKIEEMLQDRDVQVLVSSKRRSKLRITNPDKESLSSIQESSDSSIADTSPVGDYFSNEENHADVFADGENGSFFKEVLKYLDEDNL